MSEDAPKSPEWTADHARGLLIRNLFKKDLLNDEMISQEEGEILFSKPFSAWPQEMQDKLAPYGAKLIE